MRITKRLFGFAASLLFATVVHAAELTPAERGYRVLTTRPFLPADFDDEVFDALWQAWPRDLREQARAAAPAERRRMAFERYGLIESPDHPGEGPALGYTSNGRGGWVMNCLACHGGKVAGKAVPGAPNSHFGLATLTDDVRATKIRLGKKLGHMDLGGLSLPLGGTHGTTNAVMFGVALESIRDENMRVDVSLPRPKFTHHDMDAPPFWNVKRKQRLYCDGMTEKRPRPLIQFVMIPSVTPEQLQAWEPEFADILAWIESLEAPRYPWEVDRELAERGREVFNKSCARCHGTYGPGGAYPEKTIALDVVGTDPVRLHSLSPEHRAWFQRSWLGYHNKAEPYLPDGYVAPPLDGIWASAPYFHNGSVPTLWHVLHPEQRPRVWKRTEDGYNRTRVGLEVAELDAVPDNLTDPAEKRRHFDTSLFGKSAAGHDFPQTLSEEQRHALLEYLKTL